MSAIMAHVKLKNINTVFLSSFYLYSRSNYVKSILVLRPLQILNVDAKSSLISSLSFKIEVTRAFPDPAGIKPRVIDLRN